jgi:hypothetical protein
MRCQSRISSLPVRPHTQLAITDTPTRDSLDGEENVYTRKQAKGDSHDVSTYAQHSSAQAQFDSPEKFVGRCTVSGTVLCMALHM